MSGPVIDLSLCLGMLMLCVQVQRDACEAVRGAGVDVERRLSWDDRGPSVRTMLLRMVMTQTMRRRHLEDAHASRAWRWKSEEKSLQVAQYTTA